MKKTEFEKRLTEIINSARKNVEGKTLESVNDWFGKRVDVLTYSATSEYYMERQLSDLGKGKRQTTFMKDFSIGEWFGLNNLFDTILKSVVNWRESEKYMAELVLCLNWKAWEHDARQKAGWRDLYSFLFEEIRDLMYDYYEGDDKKTEYLWSFLD